MSDNDDPKSGGEDVDFAPDGYEDTVSPRTGTRTR
jgi:hypothetical protein